MFFVLHSLTNLAYSISSSTMEHTKITTSPPVQDSCVNSCDQSPSLPPPRSVYCSRSSSSPPPPKYMYVTGVPGELYRTEPDDQWGYYSNANRNWVKPLLVIVIVGVVRIVINL
ncbi:hypothetical protein V5N11_023503 [Cardamine amara subsp. amara]|uniref:Uncharacterized protein n=1 Tax=Cardamine amara subsp. amara TaxID=228776 RepID=A0ABD1AXL6_CARAN